MRVLRRARRAHIFNLHGKYNKFWNLSDIVSQICARVCAQALLRPFWRAGYTISSPRTKMKKTFFTKNIKKTNSLVVPIKFGTVGILTIFPNTGRLTRLKTLNTITNSYSGEDKVRSTAELKSAPPPKTMHFFLGGGGGRFFWKIILTFCRTNMNVSAFDKGALSSSFDLYKNFLRHLEKKSGATWKKSFWQICLFLGKISKTSCWRILQAKTVSGKRVRKIQSVIMFSLRARMYWLILFRNVPSLAIKKMIFMLLWHRETFKLLVTKKLLSQNKADSKSILA